MLYPQDRNQLRNFYREAWRKQREKLPVEPLEALVADVIAMHPEYHAMLEKTDDLDQDYLPENGQTNPFLHMGMHIALREQFSTNRPSGIAGIYQQLLIKLGDTHEAEHLMMECLAETLWQAQQANRNPDDQFYLECLRKALQK